MKTSINIIGNGNVARHLYQAFSTVDAVLIQQVVVRNQEANVAHFGKATIIHDITTLQPATVTILAVSDTAVSLVSEQIPFENELVVHVSGSTDLSVLHPKNRQGVLYPLQSFSANKAMDYASLPFCIEAQYSNDLEIIRQLVTNISTIIFDIDSFQRKKIHLAAVFVNNFVNHLYHIAADICQENEIPFAILQPLMQETLSKTATQSPLLAQTGPAKRGDLPTIALQLAQLENPHYQQIYTSITQSIQQLYEQKL